MTGPKDGVPRFEGDPIAELEAYIARAEASGEPVPVEARMMLERLRELMAALKGLTASLEERGREAGESDEDLH